MNYDIIINEFTVLRMDMCKESETSQTNVQNQLTQYKSKGQENVISGYVYITTEACPFKFKKLKLYFGWNILN